jgi:hypothetical protein
MYFDDGSGSAGGGNRFSSMLLGRVEAIRLINRPAMEDQLYELVYGREVPREIRRVLMWITAFQAKYRQHAPAEKLNELVRTANDCCRPVARKQIKLAVDLGLLSEEPDGRNTFYYLNALQLMRVRRVIELLRSIDKVVDIQERNPSDKTAGSNLLPPEVYYNITAETQTEFPEE